MKRHIFIITLFIITFNINSLKLTKIDLQGEYITAPYKIEIEQKEYTDIWNKVLDFIIRNGYKLELFNKETGEIETKLINYTKTATFENEIGKLANKKAYVVVENYSADGNNFNIKYVYASWFITISKEKKDEDLIIVVETDLLFSKILVEGLNIKEIYSVKKYAGPPKAFSTGIFEKRLTDFLMK